MKQKKMLIFIGISLVAVIIFLYKIIVNESFISKYNDGVYDEEKVKKLLALNFQEPYIAHYNYGNALFQLKNYKDAKTEYEEALKTVTEERVCNVRFNLALTEMYLVDMDESADVLKEIENIQKVLLENSCAKENGNGIDKKSQTLYDYLEQLKNAEGQGGQGSEGEGNEGEEEIPENQEVIENESERINEINKRREQSSQSRNPSNDRDYSLNYDGKVW